MAAPSNYTGKWFFHSDRYSEKKNIPTYRAYPTKVCIVFRSEVSSTNNKIEIFCTTGNIFNWIKIKSTSYFVPHSIHWGVTPEALPSNINLSDICATLQNMYWFCHFREQTTETRIQSTGLWIAPSVP